GERGKQRHQRAREREDSVRTAEDNPSGGENECRDKCQHRDDAFARKPGGPPLRESAPCALGMPEMKRRRQEPNGDRAERKRGRNKSENLVRRQQSRDRIEAEPAQQAEAR